MQDSNLINQPRGELIELLHILSDISSLYKSWFVAGNSIDEDYDFIFETDFITNSLTALHDSPEYISLKNIFLLVIDDCFRCPNNNNHLLRDKVELSGRWRQIPASAKALMQRIKRDDLSEDPQK